MLAAGVRVLPEPEEVGEARRLALRRLLHGGLTMNTSGKEVTEHLRKVARAMLDVPEESFDELQWRAYLRRIVPPGSQARQRRAWEQELAKLDAEAGSPLEGVALRMAFVRWWTTESNAIALHDALPAIGGGSTGLHARLDATSSDAALITQVLAAAQEEKRRKAAAANLETESEETAWEISDGDEQLISEYVDMESTLLANKATVCICNFCGFVHVGGDQPDLYCWGKASVERDARAEERLRQRDPERLNFLNELREQDRAGRAGNGVSSAGATSGSALGGAPKSRPTGAAPARASVGACLGGPPSSSRAPSDGSRGVLTRANPNLPGRATVTGGQSATSRRPSSGKVAMRAEDLSDLHERLRIAMQAVATQSGGTDEEEPYESNSNATAERCVHTMFSGIRANCVQAELDEGAWALAGMHTAKCYNMLGNAKTGSSSSPFVETFGYKPRGDNMRPFGSLMIVSNMSDTKGRPTLPTGERGIYVGTFDEFNSPDIDQVVGRSTCFAIKVGRRNQLLYRANAKCFPTVFPGLPLAKAAHPLRQEGPREDESEEHGVGARGGTRSKSGAASSDSQLAEAASTDTVDGGVSDDLGLCEGNREEGVTRRTLKNKSEKLCVGDRRLVPATVWPDYECVEYDGAGWEVELLSYQNGYWKVKFVHARGENGEKYADEEVKRRLLHPLPRQDGDEPLGAMASQWRAGLAEEAEDALDDSSELWSTEQGELGLAADEELLSAMQVAAAEAQVEPLSAKSAVANGAGPIPIAKALQLGGEEGAKVRQALDAELSTVIEDFGCLTPVLRGAPETAGYKEFHLGAHAIHKAADSLKAARWKVRLFFNGSEEEKDVDYDECSSPVKRSSAFRLMCGIAACDDLSPSGKWELEHSDQTGAFMHEDNERVLARMPKGLREYRVVDGTSREVLYWVGNLYGRHDAGRKFVIGHRKWFLDRGFLACTAEPCLFVRRDAKGVTIVGVYVDDCAWLCSSKEVLAELKEDYCKSYRAQFGVLTSFLGIRVSRDQEHGTVSTDLEHQIESLTSKWLADGEELKVKPTRPCDEKLLSLVSPMALEANPEPPAELRKRYMRLVGLLMYIAVTERFDVLYAVGLLARAPHKCTEELFERGLCIAAYLNATKHYKTCYSREAGLRLEACSDASHEEWGATSGLIASVAGAGVAGASKRQRCVTLSTCEAETVAASVCAAEVVSLKDLQNCGFALH